MAQPSPLVLLNTVGLTGRLLPFSNRISRWAKDGWCVKLQEVAPAVTSTAQATLLTGSLPCEHGIVGNGWLFRDTMEVRFWQQSNLLLEREPLYATAARMAAQRARAFSAAKLFWWFNQGAAVDFSLTPKPYYGADGDKRFGISGQPADLGRNLERVIGTFPFPSFWGPRAGLPATQWIAQAAARLLTEQRLDLMMVYLPHLDYDLQRFAPADCAARVVRELDRALEPLEEAARQVGARLWVVNEYGHVPVRRPIYLNRSLREAGLLEVRDGPFGEQIDFFASRAFAVSDHQLAHVYVPSQEPSLLHKVADLLAQIPGVDEVLDAEGKQRFHLNHKRSGELITLARQDAWFAYPYWLDDQRAPDFARCVDIHRKPGYDPCELFVNPSLFWPMGRMLRRLAQKKLGFRTLFDVVPLDATLVKGSHGLPALDPLDRPVLIGTGPRPIASEGTLPMAAVRNLVLAALGFDLRDGTDPTSKPKEEVGSG